MKKIQCLLGAFSVAFLVSFSGCKEEKEVTPVTVPIACKPVRITPGTGEQNSYRELEYNAQNKLTKVTEYLNGVAGSYHSIDYNAAGQAVKATSYENNAVAWTALFEYNSRGQLTRQTNFNSANTSNFSSTFEYDADGNRTKAMYQGFHDGAEHTGTRLYQYSNGNLVERIENQGTPDEEVVTYEYFMDKEDALKFYMNVPLVYFLSLSEGVETPNRNVLKKLTHTRKEDSNTYTSTKEFTYEFNDKGFPTVNHVKMTDSQGSGQYAYTFRYECQ